MRTVLLVEPVAFKRRLVARAIEVRGYRVVEVECAMAAIAAYPDAQPDVVAMNHHLPDLDGVSALKALRMIDPGARVILMGPVHHPTPVLEAKRAGAVDFVANPLGDDRLLRAIGRQLSPVVA